MLRITIKHFEIGRKCNKVGSRGRIDLIASWYFWSIEGKLGIERNQITLEMETILRHSIYTNPYTYGSIR